MLQAEGSHTIFPFRSTKSKYTNINFLSTFICAFTKRYLSISKRAFTSRQKVAVKRFSWVNEFLYALLVNADDGCCWYILLVCVFEERYWAALWLVDSEKWGYVLIRAWESHPFWQLVGLGELKCQKNKGNKKISWPHWTRAKYKSKYLQVLHMYGLSLVFIPPKTFESPAEKLPKKLILLVYSQI